MNERIQQLVGQAKFMAEETINKQISKNAELDAFAEKFALLIVRECCDWIDGSPATDAGQLLLTKSFMIANPAHATLFALRWS